MEKDPDQTPEEKANLDRLAANLRAVRLGGSVIRCHTVPHVGDYRVAGHTYGVIHLILLFNSAPSVDLLRAAANHDVAERWTGDIPSPAKRFSDAFSSSYEEFEAYVEEQYDLAVALTFEERRWLRAADIMELWLWSVEQVEGFGNRYAQLVRDNINFWVVAHQESIPRPLYFLWRDFKWTHLTDKLTPRT